jgi:hypothetical protein
LKILSPQAEKMTFSCRNETTMWKIREGNIWAVKTKTVLAYTYPCEIGWILVEYCPITGRQAISRYFSSWVHVIAYLCIQIEKE